MYGQPHLRHRAALGAPPRLRIWALGRPNRLRLLPEARGTRCIDLRPSEAAILCRETLRVDTLRGRAAARLCGAGSSRTRRRRAEADFPKHYEENGVRQGTSKGLPTILRHSCHRFAFHIHGSIFFADHQGRAPCRRFGRAISARALRISLADHATFTVT